MAQTDGIKAILAQFFQELALPAAGRLIVGVSGGPDSLALLHALRGIIPPDRLLAAHLNHRLRPSADREAGDVAETAARWGIAHVVEEVDVAGLARSQGLSLEAAGRAARYRFFARLAADRGAAAVAVAHHADDQVETVLMHLIRGAGLAGLRGMLPVSPLPGSADTRLIRPLLAVGRDEIDAYCLEHQLRAAEDRSNLDTTFFRNRIRHELLPRLERYNPQVRRRLRDLAEVVSADYAFLQEHTSQRWSQVLLEQDEAWLALDRPRWQAQPLSLRRSLMRRAAQMLQPLPLEVSFRVIEQARRVAESGDTGAQATLPGGLTCTVEYDRLLFNYDPSAAPPHLPQLLVDKEVTLPIPGLVRLAGAWVIEATWPEQVDQSNLENNPDPWLACIDFDGDSLRLRPRFPGERFRPLGMGGQTAKVKDVMVNRKIPARLRPRWPIVATGEHLVWIVGHHLDERARVTAGYRQIVQLRCRSLGKESP